MARAIRDSVDKKVAVTVDTAVKDLARRYSLSESELSERYAARVSAGVASVQSEILEKFGDRLEAIESGFAELRAEIKALKDIREFLEEDRKTLLEAIKAIPTPVMKQTIETPAAKVEVNLPAPSPTPVNLVMPDQKPREKRFVKDEKGEIIGTKEVE